MARRRISDTYSRLPPTPRRAGSKTAQGGSLTIVAKDGKVTVEGANVVKADIIASNGIIHVIDSVLTPK